MLAAAKKNMIVRLEELADKEFQSRLWQCQIAGYWSSFTEACASIFMDEVDLAWEKGEVYINDAIDRKFRELDAAILRVSQSQTEVEIINDPAMIPVRALAAEILPMIRAQNEEDGK